MKPLLLLLISSISFLSSIAQSNQVDGWDKDWDSKVKGKLKSIKVGSRATGTAIFYYKSNKSIFSIVKRSQHGWDSVSSICANFQNDTLFRVSITRGLRDNTRGSAIIYLKGNKLIEQKIAGIIFIPSILSLIDSSYKMLEYAKGELSWQLK
ncbi:MULTISPECIES: hypothetical protein [Niastella]|uniref:Uncharacterized protein n=1 Tax=Niastella soli TaxID=2821487 RepID=A0ABS3Z0Y1_9BACT|nr:hypothetical protein [Niastella soli]MBO9203820.1 hypothetical protein [Niastella soli]